MASLHQWGGADARNEITRLLAPGILGIYNAFEAINVLAFRDGKGPPINLLTIVVAEDQPGPAEKWHFLNKSDGPIEIAKLKGWTFGVMRYTQPIQLLVPALASMEESSAWSASGNPLQMGVLHSVPAQFVPPDTMEKVPLNRVLKNNFWNGSYIFEWTLKDKGSLEFLFREPAGIQDLSAVVGKYLPLNLAALTDRLGNFIIQIPVTALMSSFNQAPDSNDFLVDVAWHPKVSPRALRASVELKHDGSIAGFSSKMIESNRTLLPNKSKRGLHRGALWDESNEVLLAATTDASFINTIAFNLRIGVPEPRVFVVSTKDGLLSSRRIELTNPGQVSLIGDPEEDENGGSTSRRIYKNEIERLRNERRFVQYNPEASHKAESHEAALEDIRELIRLHGNEGVYLWDPFLSGSDVLDTLFHCPYINVDMRAVTDGQETEEQKVQRADKAMKFAEIQSAQLNSAQSNYHGLRLEFRVRTGKRAGPGFHDRFLIFPKRNRSALVWSLGHSVNAVGTVHHILQQVDDGQLVLDAFLELWERLDQPENLVWIWPKAGGG